MTSELRDVLQSMLEPPLILADDDARDVAAWFTERVYAAIGLLGSLAASPLPEQEGTRGWQPIESAPKDGTWILTISKNGAGRWTTPDSMHWSSVRGWDCGLGGGVIIYHQPTHWMPLPAPPDTRAALAAPTEESEVGAELIRLSQEYLSARKEYKAFHAANPHDGLTTAEYDEFKLRAEPFADRLRDTHVPLVRFAEAAALRAPSATPATDTDADRGDAERAVDLGTFGQLERAILLAVEAHRGQVYRGYDRPDEPYILHPLRVMMRVPSEARVAAVLHDVVEDTGWMLPEWLSDVDADAVSYLTRDKSDPYERYIESIVTAEGEAGRIARIVKEADLLENLSRNPPPRLRERYQAALGVLTEAGDPFAATPTTSAVEAAALPAGAQQPPEDTTVAWHGTPGTAPFRMEQPTAGPQQPEGAEA